jgi:DNA ligase-1
VTSLADVVRASQDVAATPARAQKVAVLAQLLRSLEPAEVPIVAALLSGVPRQGRIGIGYASVSREAPERGGPPLTVGELDRVLSEIQGTTGPGSARRRQELLDELFARATADEAGFLRGLLTGGLRQGALAALMVDAIAKAAGVPGEVMRRAVMLTGNVPAAAATAFSGGEDALRAIGFELFRPVLPMLAGSAASVAEAVAAFELASVEWKLDGIRVQIHRRGDEVHVYTRNLNEITASVPGVVAAALALPVDSVVLDGEAIGMSEDAPLAFQDTVARIDAGAEPDGVATFLFDILHVDGVDLLDAPLHERAARLAAIAPGLKVPGVLTSDAGEAAGVLEDALRAGHEGVVVKDAASPYAAGRRGRAWRKVKPVRTYDLVVLGAEWGHGRRRCFLSNLHLGARDPATNGFVMVGKTFKGLTDELLGWQTGELLAREVERRGIAVLVRPELVVEIALDGVQGSTRYPGGVALRFARVKRYRPDKAAADADTIGDLQALL